MQIRLLGDLGAQRIDDDQLAARALGEAHATNKMNIRDGRIIAPDDIKVGTPGELGRASRDRAIGSGPGFPPHATA